MYRQLYSGLLLAVLGFAQLSTVQAAIIFSDDFEDDTIAVITPAINTSSLGGDDLADIGSGWSSNLGGTNAGIRASGANQYLDLGQAVTNGDVRTTAGARLVTGTLPTVLLADGPVTIEFDLLWDFTPAGSTFAHAYVLSGGASGTPLIDLTFYRGKEGDGKRLDVLGTSGSQGVIQVEQDVLWRNVTLTLNAASFDLSVDGNTTSNLTGLSYLTSPTAFDAIQFMDSAQPASRSLQLDNLVISQIPEPTTLVILCCGAMLVWRKRCRRSPRETN